MEVPVISTAVEQLPAVTLVGLAADCVAGGGACSCITRTPQLPCVEPGSSAYSWKVQKVMLSLGSTTVCE